MSATPGSSPPGPSTGPGRVIDVSAALVFRARKLLITQRHTNSHLGGLWEFPGGKREPGESFEDCLKRELQEELGMEVAVGELVESITHAYPEKTVHLRFFLCRWIAHEPQPLGCNAVAWVEQGELRRFQFPAADERLLEMLEKNGVFWAT